MQTIHHSGISCPGNWGQTRPRDEGGHPKVTKAPVHLHGGLKVTRFLYLYYPSFVCDSPPIVVALIDLLERENNLYGEN